MAKKKVFGEIKEGWHEAGRKFEILGKPIVVNGMEWTPIVYEHDEDPDFIKTRAVKVTN